jgi:hypothetical protein
MHPCRLAAPGRTRLGLVGRSKMTGWNGVLIERK